MRLAACLDLNGADKLLGQLQDAVSHDGALLIDGSAVERISTACLQVLVAARITATARHQEFRLVAASDVFQDAARDLGLERALGMGGN